MFAVAGHRFRKDSAVVDGYARIVATDASPLPRGPSRRLLLAVVLAAVVAAAAVVGVTLLQTRGQTTTVPDAVTKARSGPPLLLQFEFGVRSTPEIRALVQAEQLYDARHRRLAAAAAIFRRYHSVEAQLGSAFASWSGPSSLGAVKKIAAANPNDPAALLNLGWADYQAGHNADAAAAWQKTASRFPDSPYGVDAEDALHSGPAGLPPIVTGLALPKAIANAPAAVQLAALKRAAARPNARAKLLYGTTLWYLRMPISAERELAAAAKLAPHDPVARTAAAVALFSKAHPRRAFAQLGPLTGVFPHSAVVEFHLGALLVYIGKYGKAAKQLRASLADGGPHSPYAQDARTLLASLAHTRSK
jgi:tetratricopeptide (TPR) repeat protein